MSRDPNRDPARNVLAMQQASAYVAAFLDENLEMLSELERTVPTPELISGLTRIVGTIYAQMAKKQDVTPSEIARRMAASFASHHEL